MTIENVVSAAASLLARVGPTQTLLAYPVQQSVEPTDNVGAHGHAFQAGVEDAVR
jgi:hypothetical protein